MTNACNENNVDCSKCELSNVIGMPCPSNYFKKERSHDKDYDNCDNQECNTSLKVINWLRADGLFGKADNQKSSFKDKIKHIIIEQKLATSNTSNMDESVVVLNSKLLNKIIDRVDELDA